MLICIRDPPARAVIAESLAGHAGGVNRVESISAALAARSAQSGDRIGKTLSFSYISSFYDMFLLAIIGFTGGTGVIFLIWGYRLVEPSLIAPFEYFGLPIAFALGWVFFSEWPFDKLFLSLIHI